MGSSISGILAILYLDTLEKQALLSAPPVGIYARYVDDVFVLARNSEEADSILEHFNSRDSHIQFEIEHPSDSNELSLLDFTVQINPESGTSDFNFFKKKAKKPLFINYHSALPTQTKLNCVQNEAKRIADRCSSNADANANIAQFKQQLEVNEYPSNFIQTSLKPKRNRRRRRRRQAATDTQQKFNFKVPYISDTINRQISKAFSKENIPVRLCHRTNSLRDALRVKQTPNTSCTKQHCPIKHTNMCYMKNVVYQITCQQCSQTYIGSTIRPLHTRLTEHTQRSNSAFHQHCMSCNNRKQSMQVKIIARDSDPINLRIREAIHIKRQQPTLNRREEIKQLEDILTCLPTVT